MENQKTPPQNPDDDAFLRSLRSDLPKSGGAMDPNRKRNLLLLSLFAVVLCGGFVWWQLRKNEAPKALRVPEKVSRTDKIIQDVQAYRKNENDPARSEPLDQAFGAAAGGMGTQGARAIPAQYIPEDESEAPDYTGSNGYMQASRGVGGAREVGHASPAVAPRPSAPAEPEEYRPPREMRLRLSKTYAEVLAFMNTAQVQDRPSSQGVGLAAAPNPAAALDSQYRTLTDARSPVSLGGRHVPAGTELRGYTNETLNTDYPSVIKGTLTSPPMLNGATVLISYKLQEERAAASVEKIIMPAQNPLHKPMELAISSVIKDGLPGLGGDVDHHWGPQIAAGVINGGLTAGALYYAAKNGGGQDLGTAVLLQPAIEKGLEGATRPINYLGRERNFTVRVDAGKEFTVLVTQGFDLP
ncbi:MAG TPA: TrbI/VirB10 family protein [Fibrobacteria bacterium]|nr:TrbI/VirB10 family protein [Fibrobacteria bacterium]